MNKQKEENNLSVFLDLIPYADNRHICRRIRRECAISRQTLANYKNGKHNIPKLTQEKINQIALEETGIEVFEIE